MPRYIKNLVLKSYQCCHLLILLKHPLIFFILYVIMWILQAAILQVNAAFQIFYIYWWQRRVYIITETYWKFSRRIHLTLIYDTILVVSRIIMWLCRRRTAYYCSPYLLWPRLPFYRVSLEYKVDARRNAVTLMSSSRLSFFSKRCLVEEIMGVIRLLMYWAC